MVESNVTKAENAANAAPRPRLRAALDKARPFMAPIQGDKLLQVQVDPVTACTIVQGAMPKIMAMRASIAALTGFNIGNVDNLETFALAAIQAQTIYLGASAPPEHFQQLVAEATGLREQLLSDATALASRGFVSAAKLEDLKGPVGYKNIASDVLTMTNMIRGNWANVAARTGVSEAELDRAEIVGDQLVNDIGLRDQSPATVAAVTLERQQAYTLMVKAYDQVRRAVTYLRWDEDDVDDIVPSLFGGKRRRHSSEVVDLPPAAPSTGSPAAPATNATAPAGTAATATTKPGVGLPGSDPFGR